MNYKLYFCADGILRVFYSAKNAIIPMTSFQQYEQKSSRNDFKFWVKWWNCETHFEEGTTLGSFLKCLEPWEDFFSDLTQKDVKAYIKESKTPRKISEESKIDWISLSYFQELQLDSEFERDLNDDWIDDINKWLNSPKNLKFNGQWKHEGYYKLSGFKNEEEDHYGVDSIAFNELVNTPFILPHDCFICIYNIYEPFFNNYEFISEKQYGIGEKQKIKFMHIQKSHCFKEVIEGFFQELDYSPEIREINNEHLKEMIQASYAEIDSFLDKKKIEENNIYTLKPHTKDIEKQDLSPSIQSHDNVIELNKKETNNNINVYARQRDTFIDERELYLNEVRKNISHKGNIKIGQLNINKEPQKRIFGFIIQDEDLISPTDFKMIN